MRVGSLYIKCERCCREGTVATSVHPEYGLSIREPDGWETIAYVLCPDCSSVVRAKLEEIVKRGK